MKSKFHALAFLALLLITVTSFQNCGGFQVSNSLSSLSSAQCKAELKSSALRNKISASELHCEDYRNYACEERIFAPNVKTETYAQKECLTPGEASSSDSCVEVQIRKYDTSGARTPASESQFAAGGSYNHEEIRCFHKLKINNLLLLDGEGDDLKSALDAAVRSCESAQGENQ